MPPFHVQISNGSDGFRGDWLMPVLLVGSAIWLATLGRVLQRADFDPVERLTWVVVVIFVPVFGMVLYWCLAPSPAEPERRRSVLDSPQAGTPWEKDPGYTLPKK